MKLTADINICKIEDWQSNAGEVNARTLDVEMCENLCSCAQQFVVFTLADGTPILSKVENNVAEIPPFDKSQYVKIGLFGFTLDGEECKLRYSPQPVKVFVNAGSYTAAGNEAPTVTTGTLEELLAEIKSVSENTIQTITEKGNIKVWDLPNGIYISKTASATNVYLDDRKSYFFNEGSILIVGGKITLNNLPNTNKATFKKNIILFRCSGITAQNVLCGVTTVSFEKNEDGTVTSTAEFVGGDIELQSNRTNTITDDASKYPTAKAVFDYSINKSDIEKEVFVNETYPDETIYNANAVNNVLLAFAEITAKLDERLSAIEENPPSGGVSYGIMKPTAEDASIEATTTASIEKTE